MDAEAMRSLIGNVILCLMVIGVIAAVVHNNWSRIKEIFTDENGKWDLAGGLDRLFKGGGEEEEASGEPQDVTPDEDFMTLLMRQEGVQMRDFDPEKDWVREHVIFSGRVQGVGFRYQAMYAARSFGLTGWVENLPDGTVEMEVQGPPAGCGRMMKHLRSGHWIRIDDMEMESLPVIVGERGFSVRGY